jgi:hypothetical protein
MRGPCAQRRCYPTGRCAYRHPVTSRLSVKLLSLLLAQEQESGPRAVSSFGHDMQGFGDGTSNVSIVRRAAASRATSCVQSSRRSRSTGVHRRRHVCAGGRGRSVVRQILPEERMCQQARGALRLPSVSIDLTLCVRTWARPAACSCSPVLVDLRSGFEGTAARIINDETAPDQDDVAAPAT